MLRVKELVEKLRQFPEEALVYAYEGETRGLTVMDTKVDADGYHPQIGFIHCSSCLDEWDTQQAVVRSTDKLKTGDLPKFRFLGAGRTVEDPDAQQNVVAVIPSAKSVAKCGDSPTGKPGSQFSHWPSSLARPGYVCPAHEPLAHLVPERTEDDAPMFGPKPGTWVVDSASDPRWNKSGRCKLLVTAGTAREAAVWIEECKAKYGEPPGDLSYTCMKD